ncbi:hypothetical protein CPIN17260_0031 [Campylobacter pinnipediorum subsp. pinnipediorum]|uniref:Uncharacterized protein n=1 Tax=Campylobacter pinnipediorum subsp. pinnipediorum TaxID=1660067 RepID=A0AAX0LCN2_9BACT|nr:hypothetical protein [Campylobacter pinnipediorum]AQW80391.1 hypothetical protein CPIN17260_0031 [Campylobacter pinnipediorum subsp. pinnipediorum]OPA81974.1 hypothetical protein BFG04_08210 [Campylobacter pinnipediorum subsp. pinnipediorum]
MTYEERLEQEKAYKEYEKHLADQFEHSEDGEFKISNEESKEWEYLNKTNQSLDIADEDEPNTNS